MFFTKYIGVFKHVFAWGKEVATGNDGFGSASRVVVLLVATTSAGCLIAHVAMNHGLPAADQMYGLSAFVASGAGAYAANKIRQGGPNVGDVSIDKAVITAGPPPEGGTNASS